MVRDLFGFINELVVLVRFGDIGRIIVSVFR